VNGRCRCNMCGIGGSTFGGTPAAIPAAAPSAPAAAAKRLASIGRWFGFVRRLNFATDRHHGLEGGRVLLNGKVGVRNNARVGWCGAPPRRATASCAFVFQSARRKRSAAVAYHFAASPVCATVSKYLPSSKATMASRVFSKRLVSCPTGSLPVRARRILAVICFQSAIGVGWDCNSRTADGPVLRRP